MNTADDGIEVQETTQQNAKDEHLLSRMLSSPESLVYLCLRKGSILQGQQVIQMFNLSGERLSQF